MRTVPIAAIAREARALELRQDTSRTKYLETPRASIGALRVAGLSVQGRESAVLGVREQPLPLDLGLGAQQGEIERRHRGRGDERMRGPEPGLGVFSGYATSTTGHPDDR